jgi:hypothetical protein
MGPFNFQVEIPTGVNQNMLEMRPAVLLDEEVIYEGEWRKGTNIREGNGL